MISIAILIINMYWLCGLWRLGVLQASIFRVSRITGLNLIIIYNMCYILDLTNLKIIIIVIIYHIIADYIILINK